MTRFKISPTLFHWLSHLAVSVAAGLAWYLLLYGRYPLYLSHVNWIYNAGGDILMHQLGWEWFRQSAWQFPLGFIPAYGYPAGTSVAFLDSIPLMALLFRPFSAWLQTPFQYFGIWELASLIGQILTGMLIVQEFTRAWSLKILGASLLVLSPPMIFRTFYHSSLSAHWLLLAAIWFILLAYRGRLWRWGWVILFGLAVLIHPYFVPMLAPLWVMSMFFYYRTRTQKWQVMFDLTAVTAVIFLTGYSIGLFNLQYDSLSASGFGLFSWNLNGFVNPFHFSSTYIQPMATGNSGQYEGFSYLGLGVIMLLPATVYVFVQKENVRRRWVFFLVFGLASLAYTLFALSNKAFLGSHPLWDVVLPAWLMEFFNLFRTSGRFIWPVFYFLVLFVLITTIRHLRYPIPVLLLVILLQWSDLQPLYEARKIPGFTTYDSPLQAGFWQAAAQTNQHLVMLPVTKLALTEEAFAIYAAHHQLTLNRGYFARGDDQALQAYGTQIWQDLQRRQAQPDTLYILTGPEEMAFAQAELAQAMYVCEVDNYTVVFSAENALTRANVDLAGDCLVPAP